MSLSRQQLTLIGIFALFLGPVILVILMRSSWWQYQPANLKNQGFLLTPPVPLSLEPAQETENKWLVLYLLDRPCQQECIDHVTALRQIHKAAGRHSEHLAIVLLGRANVDLDLSSRLESIYPQFKLLTDAHGAATTTLAEINAEVISNTGDPGRINTYIIDPMRNVVLAYRASANPNNIHKDLKRLLKWSDQEKPR